MRSDQVLQTTANYIVSQLAVWEVDYPGGVGNDNIKWRTLIWIISEGVLLCAVAINYLPPRWYGMVFRISVLLYMVDFLLCVIWLPIGVSRTYGFRSAKEVFTQTCKPISVVPLFRKAHTLVDNGTVAPAGWNWILSLYVNAVRFEQFH